MADVIVTKFGGSSLASGKQFKKVKEIVTANPSRRYVVPSAPGKRSSDDHKITDLLYMCHQLADHGIDSGEVFKVIADRIRGIHKELGLSVDIESELHRVRQQIGSGASAEFVASRGEYLSGVLLADYLDYPFIDAADVIIFSEAGILDREATKAALEERLGNTSQAVIPGFYGADSKGQVHTFSRGGSDVTGAVIADGVGADLYENWTDVPGFLKADPRIVKEAPPIERVTYKELRELSYMGAAVLHEEAIFPVRDRGIPIHIRNTNRRDDAGTLIIDDRKAAGFEGVTGIAGKKDFTVISLEKTLMDDERGFFRKLLSVFETNGISIAHMPSGIDSVSVIVPSEEIRFKQNKVLEELRIYARPDAIQIEDNMALVAIVGRGMVRAPGIAAKIFGALAQAKVNIRMITQGASEMSIIVGVENRDFNNAITAIAEVEF